MNQLIGQQIEHYLIEAVVGEGGMGTVYRAEDLNLARPVAIKVMHPQFASQDDFRQRFQQEARAAARLAHPSIVRVYQFGRHQGLLYIVMEYVPGLSLGSYVRQLAERQQIVRLNETVLLIAQVAQALGYAHRHSIIHRDVKPDNIIVKMLDQPERAGEPPLRAMVTDFGLAKLLEGGMQTRSGEFMGTLAYVSPEQVMDRPLDGRSDIYSLGVVLYQLATGQLPFNVKTPSDAILKHINVDPPPPSHIHPQLPESLDKIIMQALAKKPQDRFQSGTQMAAALRKTAQTLTDQDTTSFDVIPDEMVSIVTSLGNLPDTQDTPARMRVDQTMLRNHDRLYIALKGEAPEVYSLYKRSFTIGRGSENDIVLDGPKVSRHHATIQKTTDSWQVIDQDSTNGSFLAGEMLEPKTPQTWDPQQTLRIGAFYLQLEAAAKKEQYDDAANVQTPAATPQQVTPSTQPVPPSPTPLRVEQLLSDLRPAYLESGGICRILLLNEGEEPLTVTVNGRSPTQQVQFDAASKQINIAAGQKGLIDFYVDARKRPFVGRVRSHSFEFEVSTPRKAWQTHTGQLQITPILPTWLLAAFLILLLTLILLLNYVITTYALQ